MPTAPAAPQVGFDLLQTHLVKDFRHGSPLTAARFDPSGKYLFTAGENSQILRWELANAPPTRFNGHASWVRSLAFVPSKPGLPEGLMISGDYHGKLLFWTTAEPTNPVVRIVHPLRTIEAHQGWIRGVAVSADGTLLASCGNDALVRLWSLPEGKLLRTLVGHTCHVYRVGFHPSQPRLISGDLKGVLKDWDVSTGTLVRELDAKVLYKHDAVFMADIGGVRDLAWSADGTLLLVCGITNVSNAFAGVGNPIVLAYDWSSGKLKQTLTPKEGFQGTAWGVGHHPSGHVIAAGGGSGGQLWFWKLDQPQSIHKVVLPQSARDLALHPDGLRLAVANADGVARLYAMTPQPPEPPKPMPPPPPKK